MPTTSRSSVPIISHSGSSISIDTDRSSHVDDDTTDVLSVDDPDKLNEGFDKTDVASLPSVNMPSSSSTVSTAFTSISSDSSWKSDPDDVTTTSRNDGQRHNDQRRGNKRRSRKTVNFSMKTLDEPVDDQRLFSDSADDDLILQQYAILKQIKGNVTGGTIPKQKDDHTVLRAASSTPAFCSSQIKRKPRFDHSPPPPTTTHSRQLSTVLSEEGEDEERSCASIHERNEIQAVATEEQDFVEFANDPTVIEEQRRIMEQLELERQRVKPLLIKPTKARPSKNQETRGLFQECVKKGASVDRCHQYQQFRSNNLSSAAYSRGKRGSPPGVAILKGRRLSPVTLPGSKRDTSPNATAQNGPLSDEGELKKDADLLRRKTFPLHRDDEDCVKELYDGKKVRIRGTKHTWNDVAKGTAVIVQCPCCQSVLQVGTKAKLLYCTVCNEVSPVELLSSGVCDDNDLADALQDQEIEISLEKKMARKQRGPDTQS